MTPAPHRYAAKMKMAGLDGYVAKPIDARRLLAAIASVVPAHDAPSAPRDPADAVQEDSLASPL